MTEYEYTALLDGMGGMVEADSEQEARRQALEQMRDRLDDVLDRERRNGSNAAKMFVSDLRVREQSIELMECDPDPMEERYGATKEELNR